MASRSASVRRYTPRCLLSMSAIDLSFIDLAPIRVGRLRQVDSRRDANQSLQCAEQRMAFALLRGHFFAAPRSQEFAQTRSFAYHRASVLVCIQLNLQRVFSILDASRACSARIDARSTSWPCLQWSGTCSRPLMSRMTRSRTWRLQGLWAESMSAYDHRDRRPRGGDGATCTTKLHNCRQATVACDGG
jgi:hypothetical protein